MDLRRWRLPDYGRISASMRCLSSTFLLNVRQHPLLWYIAAMVTLSVGMQVGLGSRLSW